ELDEPDGLLLLDEVYQRNSISPQKLRPSHPSQSQFRYAGGWVTRARPRGAPERGMPDDAFLRAVRERPDDDGPRLVYADWLDGRGDPRGDSIRARCEPPRLPADDERRPDLHARAEALLAAHEADWLGPWADRLADWRFARGFLDWAAVETGPFLDHGAALL